MAQPSGVPLKAGADTPHVVIVEDDALVRSLLAEGLSDEGLYVVGSCDTSLEAMHLAEILRPDLVVMDIGLAGGDDGLLAAGRIYRETGIRCLFTTGQDTAELQRRNMTMPPALGWLQKPFTPAQLASAVKQALAQIGG